MTAKEAIQAAQDQFNASAVAAQTAIKNAADTATAGMVSSQAMTNANFETLKAQMDKVATDFPASLAAPLPASAPVQPAAAIS